MRNRTEITKNMIYSAGDVNIDMITEGNADVFIDRQSIAHAKLGFRLGGVAVNFAEHLHEKNIECIIIGKVGSDSAGELAMAQLKQKGLKALLARDSRRPTGVVSIVQLNEKSKKQRVMFYNPENANYSLSASDIDSFDLKFKKNDLVFMTGYSLFRKISKGAMSRLAQMANTGGSRIVFDLIPHDLARVGSPDEIIHCLHTAFPSGVDLLVAECKTLSFLLRQKHHKSIQEKHLALLGETFAGFTKMLCVRFGFENCGKQALLQGKSLLALTDTGYREASSTLRIGYGEMLTVNLVKSLFLEE